MQNYTEISQNDELLASLAMILNNDKTALSCSSGTVFPTANVQIGQLCFRTDENKLYQTKDAATWTEVADLSKSFAQHKADLVSRKEVIGNSDAVTGMSILRGDSLPRYINGISGAVGTIAIRLPTRRTSTMLGMKICGYEYAANKGRWEIDISGYVYSTGWTNCGAASSSYTPWGTTVRFAEDANYSYILLGITSSVWSYPKVWIDEVSLSHLAQTGIMSDPSQYEILLLTDESALTVQSTVTINSGISAQAVVDGVYASTAQTISGAKTFSGTTKVTNSTASTSATTGALVVTGGVGVGGAVNVGGNAAITGTLIVTGATTLNGGVTSTTGVFGSTVDSTSSVTGAVKVAGGLGVAKSVYLGGSLNAAMDGSFGGALGVTGKITAGSVDVTGAIKIASTTASTNKDTGALIVDGGVGIEGDVYATNVYAALKGNADTATKLANVRTINGVSFDGSTNINVPAHVTNITVNGTDLNTFITAGFFACSTSATASTLLNCPTAQAFSLLVEKSAGTVQTLTEYPTTGSRKTYKRHEYGGTWSAWYEILTTLTGDTTKLPLAGGTLTGALNGTTAAFSGSVQVGNGIQSAVAVSFLNGGNAQAINTGGVLVSNSYADVALVPTNGIYSKGVVHTAAGYRVIDDRDAKPNVITGSTFGHYFTSIGGMTGVANTVWADMLVLNGYSDSTGGNINALVMAKQSANIYHYQAAIGATTWGTPKRLAYDTDNVASATKLATPRAINGVDFDGSVDISITADLPYIGMITTQAGLDAATTAGRYLVSALSIAGLYSYGVLHVYKIGNTIHQTFYSHQRNALGSVAVRQSWGSFTAWRCLDPDNVASATKLATAHTINGVSFDGTANITVADSTKVPLAGGTMSGNLAANALGVNNTASTGGLGVSLYGGANAGMPGYGLAFSGTTAFGTHGAVTGDWATYFTMSGATNRGWIFKSGNAAGGNVASVSAEGTITGTSIVSSGNVTAYSDKRIKKNIKRIPDALAKIEALKGVTFERKDTKEKQTGLIAQEVEAVLPEAVTRHAPSDEAKKFIKDDELLSVSYGSLAGLFVEAIKGLNKKLEDQAKLIDKQGLLIENLLNKKVSHS
ncbi:tail fiber domain-containing protein [Acinetobacter tibetensis]|uniref:tail fiber domain-containing protein n=1 Tax=Acinetobacter tibetensis TaxID=2943497 RepID=UPI003A4DF4D7